MEIIARGFEGALVGLLSGVGVLIALGTIGGGLALVVWFFEADGKAIERLQTRLMLGFLAVLALLAVVSTVVELVSS